MSHIPEGELALYAAQPDAMVGSRRTEIEAHLGECAECQEAHDFFVIRDDDLGDDLAESDTWELLVGSATHTSLMEYGARVAQEDRDAEIILQPYLDNPISAAWTTLATKRRYLTGGVVRKLNTAAHSIHKSKPRIALTFADAAISVAEVLSDDLYPAHAVYQLRGTAWKERAKAQLLLGQFPQAHYSLDHAARAYGMTPHNGLGLSLVALLRAGVFYEQGRLDEAMVMAERAERGFAHAGDPKRRMDAAFLRGEILFEAGDANGALPIFHRIIEHGENTQSVQWVALGSYTAASCEVDRGNLGEASLLFHRALVIFRELGPDRELLLTEWGIARVVFHSGKLSEAIRRLRDVAAELEKRGMVTNAALVGLDISEGLLALNRPKEIVDLAQHLFSVFTDAGMLTGALTAIAYLKEAAAAKRLTKRDIEAIRAFLRRAERQPSLQFVRPPRDP
ncbi:MAG: MalT-like region [Thermoanaerobaculia bacterium]|nr:MalT-like region [Thermoanaerobaculia bacterium]